MKLLLFDIDGTLLDSGGAGMKALWLGMVRAFGLDDAVLEAPRLDLAGATDHGVATELLERYGIRDTPSNREAFFAAYLEQLEAALLAAEGFRVMPGIEVLLEHLSAEGRHHLGLLTGNTKVGAYAKLRRAGIDHHFRFGAFGTDRTHRDELGPVALKRARDWVGRDFSAREVVVIGDTPKDIRCGRAFGAVCVAVATGAFTEAELAGHEPDLLFRDLADLEQVLASLEALPGPL